MSTSIDGSVKGKCEARKRILTSSTSKKALQNSVRIHLRLARVVVSSMTRPSIWLNIGVCVMSESQRKVRPGAMMRIGGFDASMVRICTGLRMGAQHHARAIGLLVEIERVVFLPRRMLGRNVERVEIVEVVLDMRAFGHRETEIAENLHHLFPHLARPDERCPTPAGGPAASRRSSRTTSRASSAASCSTVFRALRASATLSFSTLRAAPASRRSSGRHGTQALHALGDRALLAERGDAHRFECGFVGGSADLRQGYPVRGLRDSCFCPQK